MSTSKKKYCLLHSMPASEQARIAFAVQNVVAKRRVRRDDGAGALCPGGGLQRWFRLIRPPGPDVAEPERRQHVDHALVRPPIAYAGLDQDVCGCGLGVFDEHVEIPVLVKYAGVHQCRAIRIRDPCGCDVCSSL